MGLGKSKPTKKCTLLVCLLVCLLVYAYTRPFAVRGFAYAACSLPNVLFSLSNRLHRSPQKNNNNSAAMCQRNDARNPLIGTHTQEPIPRNPNAGSQGQEPKPGNHTQNARPKKPSFLVRITLKIISIGCFCFECYVERTRAFFRTHVRMRA